MIEPFPPRATVNRHGRGLTITIPAQRHSSVVLSLAVWLCGWAVGEIMMIARIFNPQAEQPHNWPLIIWVLTWTAIGLYFMSVWLWVVFGREIVEIEGASLAIRKQTPVFTRARVFDLPQVRDLRVAATIGSVPLDTRAMIEPWRFTIGSIVFDYGPKTYRFGSGVDEPEAKQLVATIMYCYPSLASQRDP